MKREGPAQITNIKALVLDDRNANKGTERGLGLLEKSLRRYGAGRSVLADRNGRVIAGNKTVERAAELGLPIRVVKTDGRELVVVQRQDLDLKEHKAARELALADNRVAELDLDWDPRVLRSLAEEGVDLEAYFSPEELADILADEEVQGAGEAEAPPIDWAAELEAEWKTAPGQIWTIPSKTRPGLQHRLMCGDGTDRDTVRQLAADGVPLWMWTDPPYGVDYVGRTADALTIRNDEAEKLPSLLREAFARANEILADGAPVYVAHPAGALSMEFCKAFVDAGWKWHQTLVWLKDSMVLGHSDYHYKHEPLLYGWKPGKGRRWFGGRDQVSVLEVPRPKASELHPTMKPPELVLACLRNSSRAGDLGYDPFSGSGTTLVAAEQAGRACLAMELDPKYVAVALERLRRLGLEPKQEE
jgi:site-specific DNA-methyltransferase (adenine-specific)